MIVAGLDQEKSNPIRGTWNILVVEVVKKSLSAFVGGLCIEGSLFGGSSDP